MKENGKFCILFMAWLPGESEIAQRTEELVLKYNPAWTGGGIKRHLPKETPKWAKPLFEAADIIGFDVNVRFTRETWFGRMKSCRGIGASNLPVEVIAAFEKDLAVYLETAPQEFDVLHYVTVLNLRK